MSGQATVHDSKLIIEHIKREHNLQGRPQALSPAHKGPDQKPATLLHIEWRHIHRQNLNPDADTLSNKAMDEVEAAREDQLSQVAEEHPRFQQSAPSGQLDQRQRGWCHDPDCTRGHRGGGSRGQRFLPRLRPSSDISAPGTPSLSNHATHLHSLRG